MKKVYTPHDGFFKIAMRENQVARAFFKQHLPKAILEQVDLNSLQLRKDSFIDTQLNESATDMLFSINFDGKLGYLYLLVEQQRKPDRLMALRFIQYTLQIIAQHISETCEKDLPIVYPILFYNGDAAYPYPTDFFDLFGSLKGLAKQVLFEPFQLVDLTRISDEKLKEEAWVSILQIFMKHAFDRDIITPIKSLVRALQVVEQEGGRDYITSAFTYLFNTSEASDPEMFINTIKGHLSSELEENIMTLAQQFEARGEARGIEKGRLENQKAIASKLIQEGMSLKQIVQITELSVAVVEKLHKANSH